MARKFIMEAGEYVPNRKREVVKNEKEILSYYQQSLSMEETCKRFKIGYALLRDIVDKNNFVLTRNHPTVQWVEENNIDLELVRDMAKDGQINPIAKALNTNYLRVEKILKLYNIPFEMRVPIVKAMSGEEVDNVLYLRMNGWNAKEIMRHLNLSKYTIREIFKRNDANLIGLSSPIVEELRPAFTDFSKRVRRLSDHILKANGLERKEGFHWNHRYSVLDGFRNKVPVEMIASKVNLELITAKENLGLKWKSKITYEELKEDFLKMVGL